MMNLTRKSKMIFLVGVVLIGGASAVWAAYTPQVSFEGTETSATKATFTSDATYSSVKADAHVSTGAIITKKKGGSFDFSKFALNDIGKNGPSDFVGGFEFGISGTSLLNSGLVNFQMDVDSSWNGRILSVYLQRMGEKGWRKITTCKVSGGVCAFSSKGVGKFVASDYGKSRYKTESGEKYDRYDEYEEKYGSNEEYRKWFFRVNWYKKNDFPRYFQMKVAYHLYELHKGEISYEKYRIDWENYRKYVKYNTYKELRKYRNY